MLQGTDPVSAPPREASLWRFMDFTKYVAMLHEQALFFTRLDLLPDPFEGSVATRHARRAPKVSRSSPALRQRVFL